MITEDDKNTIVRLYEKGTPKKRIARIMHLDPKTVRIILRENDAGSSHQRRRDKVIIDETLLRKLYGDCCGYVHRVYEKLNENHNIKASYSTVLRSIHEYEIGNALPPRSAHVGDYPGQEIQHDTSDHYVLINDKVHKLICSGLYFRYSKMRYIKYYRRFNRFTMKCFFDEALRYFDYSASRCIIDNTSLAIHYGSGADAVFSHEMVRFAQNYGFSWYAHAIGHSNRKAGKERNFRTVETSFLPGRTFASLDDLNAQAFTWATQRYANRPQSKTGLIPAVLFETEKASLQKLPQYIHPPAQQHQRIVDQYGYIAFNGNFYWIPQNRARKVTVMEYAKEISVYDALHKKLITHTLFDQLTKSQVREPTAEYGKKVKRYKPNNRKDDSTEEQRVLRQGDTIIAQYLDFVLSKQSGIVYRHRFIRNLYVLRKKTTATLFAQAIERALHYKVNDISQIYNIFSNILKQPVYESPSQNTPPLYKNRPEYMQGQFTHENDINQMPDTDQ